MRKCTQKLENGKGTSDRQAPRCVDDESLHPPPLEPLSSTGSTSSCEATTRLQSKVCWTDDRGEAEDELTNVHRGGDERAGCPWAGW